MRGGEEGIQGFHVFRVFGPEVLQAADRFAAQAELFVNVQLFRADAANQFFGSQAEDV